MMPQTFHVEVVVLLQRLMLLMAVVLLAGGCAWLRRPPDALDRVSGTEGWSAAPAADAEAEWKAWYQARVLWRRALRDVQRQRARNHSAAALVGRPVPAAQPRARGGLRYEAGDENIFDTRGGEDLFEARRPAARAGAAPAAQTPTRRREPAAGWRRVPVEQLDATAPSTERGVVDEGEQRSRDP